MLFSFSFLKIRRNVVEIEIDKKNDFHLHFMQILIYDLYPEYCALYLFYLALVFFVTTKIVSCFSKDYTLRVKVRAF